MIMQVDEEQLAQIIHESCRTQTKGFIEWDSLDNWGREDRLLQAQYLLSNLIVMPKLLYALRDDEVVTRYVTSC